MTVCYQEQDDGTPFHHPAPGSKRSSKLHKMYQCRCTSKNSWWWAERLPETCRVVIPIKLEFSASVGFIHKEFVTMHGQTILKLSDSNLPLKKSPRKNDKILPHSVFLPSKLLRASNALFKAVTKPCKNQWEHAKMIIVVKLIPRCGGFGQIEGHTSLLQQKRTSERQENYLT